MSIADFGSFHVPGRMVELRGQRVETMRLTGTIPNYTRDPNGHYAIEGAYVQYMVPAVKRGAPVLLIHGGGMNGTVWETTPDGRAGWMRLLLEQGHPVYVVDMVERGRSGFCALDEVWPSRPIMRSVEEGWVTFRIGTRTDQGLTPFAGQRFPVEAFEQGAYAWCPRWPDTEDAASAALNKILQRVGPCHVIAHSSGCGATFRCVSSAPAGGVISLCMVEPAGLPGVAGFPAIPVLSIWADFLAQSPLWTGLRESCRTVCAGAGIDVTELSLDDVGLPGHSHLPMQDRGNARVLDEILNRHIRCAEPGLTASARTAAP